MTITLLAMRTDVRAHLDETVGGFWTDPQLNTWINDGLRDLARRTETLQKLATVAVTAGTRSYTMPADLVRCHRVEFDPGAGQIYPLEPRQFYEMDSIWGTDQAQSRAYPEYFALYGFPPTLTIYLYPVPSQSGNLNVFYYRLPAVAALDADVLDIVEGWWDLIALFAEYQALRKDADSRFSEAKAIYEEKVGEMLDITRKWHDQAGVMTTGRTMLPGWLHGGMGGEGW